MDYPWKLPDEEMFDNIPRSEYDNLLRRAYSDDSLHKIVMDKIEEKFNDGERFTTKDSRYKVYSHHMTHFHKLANEAINEKFDECDAEGKKLSIKAVPYATSTEIGESKSGYKRIGLFFDYFSRVESIGFEALEAESNDYGNYTDSDESKILLDQVEHRCFPLRTHLKEFPMYVLLFVVSALMLLFFAVEANQLKFLEPYLPCFLDHAVEGNLIYVDGKIAWSESTIYWKNGITWFLIDLIPVLFFKFFGSKRFKVIWFPNNFMLFTTALAHGYHALRISHIRESQWLLGLLTIAIGAITALATLIVLFHIFKFPKLLRTAVKESKENPPDFESTFFKLYRHCRLRVIWYEVDTNKKAPKYFDDYVKNLEKAWDIYSEYKTTHK